MEDQETKRIRSRSVISLKDIPPLDPSSIPMNSSLKPKTMMVPFNVAKQRYEERTELKLKTVNEVEEDNVKSFFSNIQIDPNSTRSVNITQEKMHFPEEEKEHTKQKSKGLDESKRESAKSVLHEICSSKRWKPPVYECCKADGPCHMRLFTYKVVVEIRDISGTTMLECFGDPKRKKKTAAEHAAEGALWYLEQVRSNKKKP